MKKSDIIIQSKLTHTMEYNYDLLEENHKLNDNIPIICPKHGLFYPRLNRFLKGSNCPHCVKKTRKTKDEFIAEANNIHNYKYKYHNFIYINSHTKSYITCPIHGDFLQTPTNHLNGCGCPLCKIEKLQNYFSDTTEIFINKARKVHNNEYIYNKTQYKNNNTKVCIICPKHGEFWQTPHNHLDGKGCPLCNESHLEKEINNLLTHNSIEFEEQKHFDWLGKQSLDFYLPQYNIAIECQGKQHFELGGWTQNKEKQKLQFKLTQQRDIKKKHLCDENGIKLLYYSNLKINYPYNVIEDKNELLAEIKKGEQ